MKTYIKPSVSIIEFSSEDIITASGLRINKKDTLNAADMLDFDGSTLKY